MFKIESFKLEGPILQCDYFRSILPCVATGKKVDAQTFLDIPTEVSVTILKDSYLDLELDVLNGARCRYEDAQVFSRYLGPSASFSKYKINKQRLK